MDHKYLIKGLKTGHKHAPFTFLKRNTVSSPWPAELPDQTTFYAKVPAVLHRVTNGAISCHLSVEANTCSYTRNSFPKISLYKPRPSLTENQNERFCYTIIIISCDIVIKYIA